jgi:transcription termination/antitermination protein NusA
VKLNIESMQRMSLFERMTKAQIKDCFEDEFTKQIVFVVQPAQIGKALGKGASNIKKLRETFGKKIKIVEYNPSVERFVQNLVFPLKIDGITTEDGLICIKSHDTKTKGLLIGRNAQALRNTEKIVKRYFKIEEIKVI